MKTVYFSDDAFAEISSAMAAAIDGQGVTIEVLASRFGPASGQVVAERARLERLLDADRQLRGKSTWRAGMLDRPRVQ
jgi:hypothetical protein